ncbi:MAG: NPCBM/NEW2 domain-containing protein, partial [Dehalococcoidia bacterium]|nr:NPCBM/NEW2 domain-containing protein [Dehalococcoidia bacterium]
MQRLRSFVRGYWLEAAAVVAAIDAALEITLRRDGAGAPETAAWFAAPAAALLVLPLLVRQRWPFAAGASVWVLAAALSFVGGSFVHLSDLAPTEVNREPFFPLPEGAAAEATLDFLNPVRIDRSPDNNVISLGGQHYFKGIGVRPRTELTFDLGTRFRTFEALCGIDDEV